MTRSLIVRPRSLAFAFALGVAKAQCAPAAWSLEELRTLTCEQALERLNSGMTQGQAEAFRATGVLFEKGVCLRADTKRAASLYQQASDRGDRVATVRLALLFASGQGAPQDYATAGVLLRGVRPANGYVPTRTDYTEGYASLVVRLAATALEGSATPVTSVKVRFDPLRLPDRFEMQLDPAALGARAAEWKRDLRSAFREAFANAIAVAPKPDPSLLVPIDYRVEYVWQDEPRDGDRFTLTMTTE